MADLTVIKAPRLRKVGVLAFLFGEDKAETLFSTESILLYLYFGLKYHH